jgi:hypothetical protein
MHKLAEASGHLTPEGLATELAKLRRLPPDVFAVHLKPTYRPTLVAELEALKVTGLRPMEAGRDYEW